MYSSILTVGTAEQILMSGQIVVVALSLYYILHDWDYTHFNMYKGKTAATVVICIR